jgi:pseudoazurin
MKYILIILSILVVIASNNPVLAEDATVEMLNKVDKRYMAFSHDVVRVNSGNTVFWKATKSGHNVKFIMKGGVPKGVNKFKSKVSKDTEYTFTIPGIYAYWCVPHKGMGMIGFVVVDNDLSNLEAIKNIKYRGKSKKIAKKIIAHLKKN